MGGRGGDIIHPGPSVTILKQKKKSKSQRSLRTEEKPQLEELEIKVHEEAAKSFQDTCVNL